MCKVGDLLLIERTTNNGRTIGRHPFIVFSDENGIIKGTYNYDFLGFLLSSNETEEKREKMLKYDTNFPVAKDDKIITDPNYNNLNSFVEFNPFFYFSKDKITFRKIGRIDEDIFNLLVEYLEELNKQGTKFKQVIDNAKPIEEAEEA